MLMRSRIRFPAMGLFAVCALACAVIAFLNSERLDAVSVRFTGPGAEPEDVQVLGLGKDHVKPDYRLDVVHAKGSFTCATVWDTSAAAGIRFPVSGEIPIRDVRELVLIEKDSVSDDDPVTRVAFRAGAMSASGYAFGVESSRSFSLGFSEFLRSPVGTVLIIVAVVLLLIVLGTLAPFLG